MTSTARKTVSPNPSIAIVIGTFGTPCYVQLQLEAAKRFYPDAPVLVHDDGSLDVGLLRTMCRRYGADFETTQGPSPNCIGDLRVYAAGLVWAHRIGVEIVLKLSRRYVLLGNWLDDIRAVAVESDYATYGSYCDGLGWGFITCCMAMHVQSWQLAVPKLGWHIATGIAPDHVERYLHSLAREVRVATCSAFSAEHEETNPKPPDRRGYADLSFMAGGAWQRNYRRLWHDVDGPERYLQIAREWGLNYSLADFAPPGLHVHARFGG